ncbi:MAG: phosphoenolpyruvate carboxylase, partial [bacterium]|nr:phosphoenolpyruvate carboxylase [bacterium]
MRRDGGAWGGGAGGSDRGFPGRSARRRSISRHGISLRDKSDNERRSHSTAEPYRTLLGQLRQRLDQTRDTIQRFLDGKTADLSTLISEAELRDTLLLCHQSLLDCGMQVIAGGLLEDVIRRVACF